MDGSQKKQTILELNAAERFSIWLTQHTVSWLNCSVTLLVSKAPLNRKVKKGCF